MHWRTTTRDPKRFTYCGPSGGIAGNSSFNPTETLRQLATAYQEAAGKDGSELLYGQDEELQEDVLSKLAQKLNIIKWPDAWRPRITFVV